MSGLISVAPVQRRRNRKNTNEASFHSSSYFYRVRIKVNDKLQDVSVCYKAFLSLFGITNHRVQTIKKSLTEFGESKADLRGNMKTDLIDLVMKQKPK